jgi:hypothetical protein
MNTTGYCGDCALRSHTLTIGDTDCGGRIVGYIDPDGLCWESEFERDVAVGAGRVLDGITKWDDFPVTPEKLVTILDQVAFHRWLQKTCG